MIIYVLVLSDLTTLSVLNFFTFAFFALQSAETFQETVSQSDAFVQTR